MEGKEVRFGVVNSALGPRPPPRPPTARSTRCTIRSCRLGGLVPLWLMQLGEIIYGGVGSGLYGMLLFAIVTVFIAGLMVGRTPEYLGKKIEAFEMKMASVAILVPNLLALVGTALAVTTAAGRSGVLNPGPHGIHRDAVRLLFDE
jgi:K+-transporting ATPase, A chain